MAGLIRTLAAEHIDTQRDDFGQSLEKAFAFLLSDLDASQNKKKNLSDHPSIKKIEDMIFDRFKLKVKIITNSELAAIMPFYSNRNHIFLPEFFRGLVSLRDQSKLLSQMESKQGTVNLKTATLGGIFSEYVHPLYLNIDVLTKTLDLSPGELAAVTLHEIGHGFNSCSYSDRTDEVNQVLATVAKRILNRQDAGDVDYIYRELKKINPSVMKEEIDSVLNGPRVVAGLSWFRIFTKTVRNLMQNNKYNETAFEQLSDSFAARFGYGAHLSQGLKKILTHVPEYHNGVRAFIRFSEVVMIALMGFYIFAMVTAFGAIGIFLSSVLSYFFLYTQGESATDYTYDKLKERYVRIRQDIVDQLKDDSLPRDVVKSMLTDIYTMDEVIKEVKPYNNLLSGLSNILFADNRDAKASIELQQLMEKLASNELFVKSAQFKTSSH